ncbi:MAG: potassium channel protein [Planctomycetes bacterium]|nr:potassium channel protein [Planctomycetota bacterium]
MERSTFWRQVRIPSAVLVSVVLVGALGYRVLEGWSWLDSFYMAVTTLATVGFGEVHPLSDAGRIFTIALIAGGLGAATYLISALGRVTFEEMLGPESRRRRMKKQIDAMEGHFVLCGAGRVGRLVLREFEAAKAPFVVLERDERVVRELKERSTRVLHGDATSEELLDAAGIGRARGLVTALPDDAANLYVVITARDRNPDLSIVARAETASVEKRLLKAGANRVISPNSIGGRAMAQALLQPEVLDFLSLATARDDLRLQIEQIAVMPSSALAREKPRVAEMRERHGVFVVALRKDDDGTFEMPENDRAIDAGDTLIVVGRTPDCEVLSARARPRA